MPIKSIIVKKSNHEHDIIWKEVDDLVDVGLAMELEDEEEAGEDFRRIRSHVMNEVEKEEEKKEKYKQLEFDFEDYNISEDQVAPI